MSSREQANCSYPVAHFNEKPFACSKCETTFDYQYKSDLKNLENVEKSPHLNPLSHWGQANGF